MLIAGLKINQFAPERLGQLHPVDLGRRVSAAVDECGIAHVQTTNAAPFAVLYRWQLHDQASCWAKQTSNRQTKQHQAINHRTIATTVRLRILANQARNPMPLTLPDGNFLRHRRERSE